MLSPPDKDLAGECGERVILVSLLLTNVALEGRDLVSLVRRQGNAGGTPTLFHGASARRTACFRRPGSPILD
jgi:hypothetical protein